MGERCILTIARWLGLELPNVDPPGGIKQDGGSFGDGQIQDEFEHEPVVCDSETYYQKVRGDNGYWPPNQLGDIAGVELRRWRNKLWATLVIDSLEKIDAINCCFMVRIKLFLVWQADLQNTPIINKFHTNPERLRAWRSMIQKAKEFGGPYKLEDQEYELFEDELIYPQSLGIRNMICCTENAEKQFEILDPFKGEVWMKYFDGLFTCREVQELAIFPFDVQDLHIDLVLASRVDQDRFDLRLHTVEFSRAVLDVMEWTVYPPETDRKGEHGTSVRLVVVRRSLYYMKSIIMTSLLFSVISLTAFSIPIAYESNDYEDKGSGIAERVSMTLTMMLTSVAFKFAIAEELPRINYYTELDKFLVQHFGFIFLLSVYFTMGPYVCNNADEDLLVCWGMTGFLSLITFRWCFNAWVLVKARDYKLPPPVPKPKGDAVSWRWQRVPHIEKIENGDGPPARPWLERRSLVELQQKKSLKTGDRKQTFESADNYKAKGVKILSLDDNEGSLQSFEHNEDY